MEEELVRKTDREGWGIWRGEGERGGTEEGWGNKADSRRKEKKRELERRRRTRKKEEEEEERERGGGV